MANPTFTTDPNKDGAKLRAHQTSTLDRTIDDIEVMIGIPLGQIRASLQETGNVLTEKMPVIMTKDQVREIVGENPTPETEQLVENSFLGRH
ncbi:MAG: hypothetical protein QM752_05135 [Gammaproteobacteria bacterium]